ncbi:MAG: hypothetical protein QM535_07040 [Limnohabitans sp.]|nr:hypothetical protein [Limnohabitans sp.]
MLPNFGSVIIYSSFKLNQEEISKTLCIQKDLVKNTCNGRCVLELKLKKIEQSQKSTEIDLKEKCDLVYILSSSTYTDDLNLSSIDLKELFVKETIGNTSRTVNSFFHPPTV